ncbi:MAG: hypothetical protein NTZ85_01345 [Bacteroidia bacterium]|nr:hypothetical protein [Bacteroidia bacterium]
MNDIENIQFEERIVYPAVTWGIISGMYTAFLMFVLKIDCSIYSDYNEIIDYGLLTTYGFFYLSNWAINITIAVWIVRIARKLNRPPILWGILGLVFAPITLIAIGFMDYKIEDSNVKKIVDESRIDFNSELFHIKSIKDLSEKEMNEVEIKLKEKFSQKLKDRIARSQLKERMTSFNMKEQVTLGIISGMYIAFLMFVLKIDCSIYSDPNEIIDYGLLTTYGFFYLSNWAINIAIAVWIVRIARKLNRPQILWGILGLVFAPITLIVFVFFDYKIEDRNVKKIVDELQLDFNSEYLHIKSTKDLTREELDEVEIRLKEKFKLKLRERISESNLEGRTESEEINEQERTEEQKRIEAEEDEVVQAVSDQHWTGENNKCPACGAPFGDNAVSCPECGLTIKQNV